VTLHYDEATKRAKVVIYAGLDERGQQRQRSKTWRSPNLRTAKREAATHEHNLRADLERLADRAATLNGLIDRWEKMHDATDSPSTVRGRRGMVKRLRHDLGRIPLDRLTAPHVDDWLLDMRTAVDPTGLRTMSDTTIANHWTLLRAVLRQGKRWKMVANVDAVDDARPPKRTATRRPSPPTAQAFAVLFDSARPDLRIAIALAAYAGLRRGEILALRWSDVDGNVLHVHRALVDLGAGQHQEKLPKWDHVRDVDIDDGLAAMLAEHRLELVERALQVGATLAADGPVLADIGRDPTGRTPRRLGWLTLAWSRHADKMGAPDVRLHDLRHHYATELIDAGVPLPTVQRQLGHTQLTTTANVYAHAVDSGGRRAAAAIQQRRDAAREHHGIDGR